MGEAVLMKPIPNMKRQAAEYFRWQGAIKFLLLVLLVAIIFLLGQDMVRHRFFRGGWVNNRGVLKP